ncbi:MAG: cupin domain-containing protein [Muribaculaceae bacterium]|jgi:transcriptional regulator with XRE-family HTH domain|nr:cupin domain-containing protein [Prevotella sp.]MBR4698552.1 cupin domain-containing protein [Prevotella sp.]MBR6947603.1 cupin domain-containing protein [Muribaculaceae bacterium]
MDEQIKQIGERLRGLRDVLDIPVESMASLCGITVDRYEKMERGEAELSVANLQKIAKKYGVSLDVLMFGEEPKMSTYFLTRKGQGQTIERRRAYQYESLASGFRGRKADPFIVTVEPKPANTPKEMNSHSGQEFNMVLEGSMELTIGTKVLTLSEGDSVYFDATQPHGMRTVGDEHCKFLAIIF